ncbi:MAG: hypothetical protein IVW55_08220 [Chloroflexi bacterium]|nr:hypothetical protein [Chloroflexota bacterium]
MTDDQHNTTSTPPDRGSAGDVSTTGHSTHDVQDTDGGHGSAVADTSDVSTLVPTTWKQLIFPALILLVVLILVAGPVASAFAPRPAAPTASTESPTAAVGEQGAGGSGGANAVAATSTAATGQNTTAATPDALSTVEPGAPSAPSAPSATTLPQASPTTATQNLSLSATQTAVWLAGESGEVARIPVQLQFEGTTYSVNPGTSLLPDWKQSQDPGTATWIEGTVTNHILYLPYTDQNAAIFSAAKVGDALKLRMNTGQTFSFDVTKAQRAVNGPATTAGQFTVTAAMAQDHAGVTLFLVGDPASDRAVVQADFTGTIQ